MYTCSTVTRITIKPGGSKTNKKLFSMGVIILFIGILFIHSVSSQESISSSLTHKERRYNESPLFQTRLLSAIQKITRLLQIRFLRQDRITIPFPLSGRFSIFRLGQAYTSYNTGACVHPTECPCITSGEWCKGGEPTRGYNCK